MNDEQAIRTACASLLGELSAALHHATAEMRADEATARQANNEKTVSRLNHIERRLEEILAHLTPPSSSAGIASRRLGGLSSINAIVIAIVALLALVGATCGKLVGDRAYTSGRAVGYAQAAIFERDHPAQWRAYQRGTTAVQTRRS